MSKDKPTHPSERSSLSGVGASGGASDGVAKAAPATPPVRTPWGRLEATQLDQDTRDPFEPDAPLSAAEAAARAARKIEPSSPPPLSPRELFEMLMTPAAQATRSSPLRKPSTPTPTPTPTPMTMTMTMTPDTGAATTVTSAHASADAKAFPAQANVVLSALDAGQAGSAAREMANRRAIPRRPYRVKAALRLFSDGATVAPRTLYTRDIHSRGIGFIAPQRLPLGYAGTVELPAPNGGAMVQVACTLLRCREAAPGWFEGALCFNREQAAFADA